MTLRFYRGGPRAITLIGDSGAEKCPGQHRAKAQPKGGVADPMKEVRRPLRVGVERVPHSYIRVNPAASPLGPTALLPLEE